MLRQIYFFLIVAASLPVAAHAGAGYGTITETDTAIIVEYYGNPDDVRAVKLAEERNEKSAAAAAARQQELIEISRKRTKAKQAARFAERDAREAAGIFEAPREREEGE